MANCLNKLKDLPDLSRAADTVRAGGQAELSGLLGSSIALVLSKWLDSYDGFTTLVAANEQDAGALKDDLEYFLEAPVPLYPAAEHESLADVEKRAILSERVAILSSLGSRTRPSCLVVPASGFLAAVPPREDMEADSLVVKPGDQLSLDDMRRRLIEAGFLSAPMVTAPGEFSFRGDIVDIYPMAFERPIRIELFDEEVESIREIDLETQCSISRLDGIRIPLLRMDAKREWIRLHELLPLDHALIRVEPDRIERNLKIHLRELGVGSDLGEEVLEWIGRAPGLVAHPVSTGRPDALDFKVFPARGQGRLLSDIRPSIEALREQCAELKILCRNEAEASRLKEVMIEQEIPPSKSTRIEIGRLSEGFLLASWNIGYINHHELLRRLPARQPPKPRPIKARALESYSELKKGDLVVHLVHGVARYAGMVRMDREGGQEDFLKLEFDRETLLYVPASKIHLVEKYIGGGGSEPKLDKLGGKGFVRRKEKVAAALEDLAAELLEVQAARDEERGHAYDADDDLQVLFDASFPYQDTEDQTRAIFDIKRDMRRRKPMDRLLCGDVGFGKTELAIRAAFKAVAGGMQVAVLVPTTILAQQHYETFRTRLSDYPVTVEVLSRFKSRAQQKAIVDETREMRVDILIGTHRILSEDVGFKRLGLLIIDEEQRFGVVHKERLKRIKQTVDVLTMTATPIPRTLHMALVGMRDISNLETAPEGRMPIDTAVIYKSDNVIKRAVLAEVSRGGQVFYLHNRVDTIGRETDRVRRLVPEARTAFAHGRMSERELERVMIRFIRGDLDVLVCTTIIESGIDLPGVNTILIDRADRFGLADLHQLRGRVGRGNVRARALLLIPRKPLPDIALRRLKAIEELSHLGAGFKIALKDLEIRGAGNILGAEQHGHIAAVGYELYCRLLRQTILKAQGLPHQEADPGVDLDIKIDAFIPTSYITDENMRIEMLRRLSRAKDLDAIMAIRKEMRDRFGRIPKPVQNLIDLCIIKKYMIRCGIGTAACPIDKPYMIITVTDGKRYAERAPFTPNEMRFVAPMKAHFYPRCGVRQPKKLMDYIKKGLRKACR